MPSPHSFPLFLPGWNLWSSFKSSRTEMRRDTHRSLTTGRPVFLTELAARGCDAHHLTGEVYQLCRGQLRDFPCVSNEEPARSIFTVLSWVCTASQGPTLGVRRHEARGPARGFYSDNHSTCSLRHSGMQMAQQTAFNPASVLPRFQPWPLVARTLAGCEQKAAGFGEHTASRQIRLHRCPCRSLKGNDLGEIMSQMYTGEGSESSGSLRI